jgi:RNA polymerase sigma factor (TIGR02999 family)
MLRTIAGDRSTISEAQWQLVNSELRRLADRFLRSEAPGHTLQPTALVHEAFLRIFKGQDVAWKDRRHFFAVAAQAMRRILIDHARKSQALKRGGGKDRVDLTEALEEIGPGNANLVALDDALNELNRVDSELAQVVELRFFGGLTIEETAEVLGVAPITIQRRWRVAKGWLFREIAGDEAE